MKLGKPPNDGVGEMEILAKNIHTGIKLENIL